MSSATPALIALCILLVIAVGLVAYLIQKLNEAKDRAEAFRFTGLTLTDWLEVEIAKRRRAERMHAIASQQVEVAVRRRTEAAMDLIEAQMRRDDAEASVLFLLDRLNVWEGEETDEDYVGRPH